jgi:hypothetical protein
VIGDLTAALHETGRQIAPHREAAIERQQPGKPGLRRDSNLHRLEHAHQHERRVHVALPDVGAVLRVLPRELESIWHDARLDEAGGIALRFLDRRSG